jgi:hypothetical protein
MRHQSFIGFKTGLAETRDIRIDGTCQSISPFFFVQKGLKKYAIAPSFSLKRVKKVNLLFEKYLI